MLLGLCFVLTSAHMGEACFVDKHDQVHGGRQFAECMCVAVGEDAQSYTQTGAAVHTNKRSRTHKQAQPYTQECVCVHVLWFCMAVCLLLCLQVVTALKNVGFTEDLLVSLWGGGSW